MLPRLLLLKILKCFCICLIEDNGGKGGENSAERKAYLYYQSCIDSKKIIENLQAEPLLKLLDDVFGTRLLELTLLEEGSQEEKLLKFQNLVLKIHSYGLSPFFTVWIGEDEKNSSRNIFQVTTKILFK